MAGREEPTGKCNGHQITIDVTFHSEMQVRNKLFYKNFSLPQYIWSENQPDIIVWIDHVQSEFLVWLKKWPVVQSGTLQYHVDVDL